jgi:hypothetical protein
MLYNCLCNEHHRSLRKERLTYCGGGVRLCLSGTAASNGPIVHPPMIHE